MEEFNFKVLQYGGYLVDCFLCTFPQDMLILLQICNFLNIHEMFWP